MKKITYLFGAGASANALPVLKQIPDRLNKFLGNMSLSHLQLPDQIFDIPNFIVSKAKIQKEFLEKIRWLINLSERHASIDTAAKKLYITDKESDLDVLKIVLSIFLTTEQLNNNIDMRYDAFFASLLQKKDASDLPENVRIVSWNYDLQFEMAYREFYGEDDLSRVRNPLNVYNKFDHRQSQNNKFGIFKLNGVAGIHGDRALYPDFFTNKPHTPLSVDFVERCMRSYAIATQNPDKGFSSLSFAWESRDQKYNVVECATEATKDTEILVCIGYSFPFFNRVIDRSIIQPMNLKKVYVQDQRPATVIDRLKSIRDDLDGKVFPIEDVDQFFLPPEL